MILVLGPKTRTRITNSVESVLVDFLNLFMHVFSYVLGGSDTNCNCSGVLVAAILIIKATKTPPQDIVGMNITCKKCGTRTNGLACPKCKNESQSFGV